MILRAVCLAGGRIGSFFDRLGNVESYERILIFQGGGIGDIMRIFPLILSLHHRFPKASLFTLTSFPDIFLRLFPESSIIKECIPYDLSGEHRGLMGKWRLVHKLRKYDFDLIINPARGEGMLENSIISYFIGASCRVGFIRDGAGFLNSVKISFEDDRPILEQNLNLLSALSIEPTVNTISIRIPEEDLAFGNNFRQTCCSRGKRLITIHTGSHWRDYLQWPLEKYIDLTKEILRNFQCKVALVGTSDETNHAKKFETAVGDSRIINMVGKTTFTQVAAIIKYSDLFIGNDSGPLHISLALRVPSIGIFGYTSPRQVISPNGPCVVLHKETQKNIYLHQPFFKFKPKGKNPILLIEVSEVFQAVQALLTASVP